MKKIRVHVTVSGHVQGVFFRSFLKSNARLFEVNGWVKNAPNGKVEAVFEGDEYNVNKMVELCRQGPPGSDVKEVDVKDHKSREALDTFEIRH